MFERLGTPKDRKKWVVYDDGHSLAVRRNEVVKEALDWLDRYLGPDQLIRRLYRLPPPSGGPESFLKQEV
jgi:hypothetical protein